jgi:general secretion pathway protein D
MMKCIEKIENINNNNRLRYIALGIVIALTLSACASSPQSKKIANDSYLKGEDKRSANVAGNGNVEFSDNAGHLLSNENKQLGLAYLSSLHSEQTNATSAIDLTEHFSAVKLVQLTADNLPLKDYLHHVLGDLLGVSYVLGEQVKADNKSVTLNLQKNVSQQKIFNISEQLLIERGYIIRLEDDIYYIHKAEGDGAQGNFVYGYGQNIENVPNSSATIVQLVPFVYGMQPSLASTIQQLVSVKATADFQRSNIILQGKRKEIIKALEFVQLMDQPLFKNRHIGVYKGTYVSAEELIEKLPVLLKQDGISVSGVAQSNLAVSMVSLDRIGTVIIFANNKQVVERVAFWAKQIDQAPSGNQLQYFLYAPKFARAKDLGESLQLLISGTSSNAARVQPSTSTSAAGQNENDISSNQKNSTSVSNKDMSLVVDGRANSLIFNTTGDKYRQLLPLIKRLDVMPKQVILEVMIAEVKLTDEFKQGVDFEFTNQGTATSTGGFKLTSNTKGLTYLLTGNDGKLNINLFQKNDNVNVLSRPSLLVRDGVTANITVGDKIPTVGETIVQESGTTTTSVVYLNTGIKLQVKPTINARGTVIMEIDQEINNQAAGSSAVSGNPILLERSIQTEVVAESGQTIILGGLISETRTINDTSVPFFSSIPLIGKLFDTTSDTGGKTELVVLVTPRVIESGGEWEEIKAKFAAKFKNIDIN